MEQLQRYLDEVVGPGAAAMARGEGPDPASVARTAGEYGLAGLLVPVALGGAGGSYGDMTRVIGAVARLCASTSVVLDVHASVAVEPLLRIGTPAQQRRYLPEMAAGRLLGAFALTEPQGGSDTAHLRARAEPDGTGYRITGTKAFITNGGAAALYIVMARAAGGISAFLVEAGSSGLSAGRPLAKMGLHGSWTTELILDGVFVGAEQRLGAEGDGLRIALGALDIGRVGIAAQAAGLAWGAVDIAASRVVADEVTAADMVVRAAAAEQLTLAAAAALDAGAPATLAASVAKVFATDSAVANCQCAFDLCAPDSARADHPAAIRLCDAKATQIYEGTNQIQRIVIARRLLTEAVSSR